MARSKLPRGDRPDHELRSRAVADYEVGYARPPRAHQFKPGQSGNPQGRPKGSKGTASLVRDILDRKIEVRSGSRVQKISVRKAFLTRQANNALKGDLKAAHFLLQYDKSLAAAADAERVSPISEQEQEIIDAYNREFRQLGDKDK
jgi:hypothetical protein